MQEKRSHPRVPLDITVTCERTDGEPFTALCKDLSIGGMFVECELELPFNTELMVVARLPGAKQDLRLPGMVRWVKPGGFGIQFGLLGAQATHAISQLMRG